MALRWRSLGSNLPSEKGNKKRGSRENMESFPKLVLFVNAFGWTYFQSTDDNTCVIFYVVYLTGLTV